MDNSAETPRFLNDPKVVAISDALEARRLRERDQQLSVVLRDLQAAGYFVKTLYDLTDLRHVRYPVRVAEILSAGISMVENDDAKVLLAHALDNPSVPGVATPSLIKAFLAGPRYRASLRSDLGMAIQRCASKADIDALLPIALDSQYGSDRSDIVLALGRLGRDRPDVPPVLLKLLRDPTVHVSAAAALGRLKHRAALKEVEKLLQLPEAWKRAKVKRIVESLKKLPPPPPKRVRK